MRFTYCPDCGSRLELRPVGDEGDTPWCTRCEKPLFDLFASCIIALVINPKGEVAVLRQGYLSQQYGCLVSGYIKPGETAEQCAVREIREELGLEAEELQFAGTFWKERSGQLMIGFFANTRPGRVTLSGEVDSMQWMPPEQALTRVHPAGSISHALVEAYLNRK